MKSRDYVLANLISWSLIGIIQVIILLIVAVLIGYHWQGGLISMIYAIILGIITTISSVALSMIIVSLSKSVEQATNLAPIIVVPLSFLAGSFFPMKGFDLFTINGYTVDILEISPWYQATQGFTSILTYGNGLMEILPRLVVILLMGLILLAIAMILFNRKLNRLNN